VEKINRGTSQMRIDLTQTAEIEKQLKSLEDKEKKLSRNVNVKAMNMLGHMQDKVSQSVTNRELVTVTI
jgi:hypothetical protein